ncbi:MAG TPA: multicopper oxidase domain-containing protein [Longimicrobium sp.]|nr:multicopper oxidase domain-containing protein [Longimicrobium sp.]
MLHAPSTAPEVPAHPPAEVPLGRRLLLGLVPAASLAVVAAACATAATPASAPSARPSGATLADAASTDSTWREPREFRAGADGVLRIRLRATMDSLTVPTSTGSNREYLRTYQLLEANGISYADSGIIGFPGPTLRVRQGNRVSIWLINDLPATDTVTTCNNYPASQPRSPNLPAVDTFPECFHRSNHTNLHFHGFHVSPRSPADNVLLTVAPGDSMYYEFVIPENQSPGTHWYHPHLHGSVAVQVTNGMSGAFIVDGGPVDDYGFDDVLAAVQEIDASVNLMDTTFARVKLVNGMVNPVISVRPGEVKRLRLVNENISATATYGVLFPDLPGRQEPELYDIARDGVQYAPQNYNDSVPDDTLLVAPGSRLDMFLVAPTDTGTHEFRAVVPLVNPESRKRSEDGLLPLTTTQSLFTVRVSGAPMPPGYGGLPDSLPPLPWFLQNLDATDTVVDHDVMFADSGGTKGKLTPNPPSFFMGTLANPFQQFNDSVPLIRMPLDSTQLWKVWNLSVNKINHPFHIHINPFQVDSVYAPLGAADPSYPLYQTLNEAQMRGHPIWLDVLPLPRSVVSNGVVTDTAFILIRQEFADFTGPYVMHCHILGHEERGMMQRVDVVGPPGAGAGRLHAGAGRRAPQPPALTALDVRGAGRPGGTPPPGRLAARRRFRRS